MVKKTEGKNATKTAKEYLKCSLTKEEVAVAANELAEELDNLQAHEDALTMEFDKNTS